MDKASRDKPTSVPRTELPVLMVAFNRLDTLQRVLEAVRLVQPPRLYLATDGARMNRPGEAEQVVKVRAFLETSIDWDCDVQTLHRNANLGCALAISGAVNWFFEHEDRGVILEDDCLPDPSFFKYASLLLDRYAKVPRIMHISGTSQVDFPPGLPSYFFSNYPQVWGWATWRDRWEHHSLAPPNSFNQELEQTLEIFGSKAERQYWSQLLKFYYAGGIDTWDYAWAYSIWRRGGLSTYPTVSMVKNIGFDADATHTKWWKDYRGIADRPLETLDDIVHPASREVDRQLDYRVFQGSYAKPPLPIRVSRSAARLLRHRVLRARSD